MAFTPSDINLDVEVASLCLGQKAPLKVLCVLCLLLEIPGSDVRLFQGDLVDGGHELCHVLAVEKYWVGDLNLCVRMETFP